MDFVKTYIYDTDIRLKAAVLDNSLKNIKNAQNIPEEKMPLFSKAALLASAFSSEQKDDNGEIFVTVKDPESKTALTVICETDGRLRGSADSFEDSVFPETILTVGQRLITRGDYQSSVMGNNIEMAAEEYFTASRQTQAKTRFFTLDEAYGFIFAEYFPGHDVNFKDENKKPSEACIKEKLERSLAETLSFIGEKKSPPDFLKEVSESKIVFGCTCNKRKIKNALADASDITLPVEVKCRFCGKTYVIDNI